MCMAGISINSYPVGWKGGQAECLNTQQDNLPNRDAWNYPKELADKKIAIIILPKTKGRNETDAYLD